MDFSISETQRELAGLTRQILTDHATPARLASVEATGERFDRELWAALASAGVLSAVGPESIGGGGLDLLEQCSVLVELGRAVAPVPYLPTIVCDRDRLLRHRRCAHALRGARARRVPGPRRCARRGRRGRSRAPEHPC
jgi:3-oxocholest-4-en-26-oyl-CoA dehydrogenase beta subunit